MSADLSFAAAMVQMRTGLLPEPNLEQATQLIREAAAATIKQLSVFRSAGSLTQEALDAEVARIAREKLQPHGCDLVVHRTADGITRFLIKVQSTGRRYDLIKSFFHRDYGSIGQMEV